MTKQVEKLVIPEPNIRVAEFEIIGTAPYCQNKFSQKVLNQLIAAQSAGAKAKNTRKKESKDFDACYQAALHVSEDGWYGIPASAFRSAMISACRVAGFQMTKAKLTVFILPDGFDADDASPLVKITRGKPKRHDAAVRNETGVVDIRPRPKWDVGWKAKVRVQYDADQFGAADVANLLMRAGLQVGVGEGRPDSKKSHGIGWGTFSLADKEAA